MKNLFSPWRDTYTNGVHEHKKDECPFCFQIKEKNDDKNLIIVRSSSMIVMLNKHPYNAGHLLIVPIKHVANLYDLDKNQQQELMRLTTVSTKILKKTLQTDGINVGINLGKNAGGSIPQHLHMHVLPRWQGDTTFMPLIADTKVISSDMQKIYQILQQEFKNSTP